MSRSVKGKSAIVTGAGSGLCWLEPGEVVLTYDRN